jgi:hypothetical protein
VNDVRPRVVLLILIAGAILCALAARATAQSQPPPGCGPLPAFLAMLQARFNEFRVLDLEMDGGKLVVTRSNEGTWTILRVEGQDAACVFAMGKTSIVDRGV